jgi:hypothetical protein
MKSSPGTSTDLSAAMSAHAAKFPFASELSFRPLIAFWETLAARQPAVYGPLGRDIRERLRSAPELLEPIEDLSVIARHRPLVEALMSAVFSPADWDSVHAAAMVPFRLQSFYGTPSFQREMMSPEGVLQGRLNIDEKSAFGVHVLEACATILERVYGISLELEYPLVLTYACPETGLERHYKMEIDGRFIDVRTNGPVPELAPDVPERLRAAMLDPAVLSEVLPRDTFIFSGFAVFRAVDVTDGEVLSSLKRDLIHRESIVSNERFRALQDKLRVLFRRPDLQFGLAAIEGDRVMVLNHGARVEHACIFADSVHHRLSDFAGSFYEKTVLEQGPVIVSDLGAKAQRTPFEDMIMGHGMRALLAAPLYYQDELIGTIGLKSPHPGDFDTTHLPLLNEVLPLFAMAVKRSVDELHGRIQAVIKEKATAIHPVVEWAFQKAVIDSMERMDPSSGSALEMAPIVFRDVYPLYALSDIRGSSTQRAWAIQSDLLTQLGLARDVLRAAHDARPLPVLDQLVHRLDGHTASVEVSLRAGDESALIAFLRGEIEPLFDHLQTFGPAVHARIDTYRRALDPTLGAVYDRRKAFEDSVTLINDEISAYISLEEQAAQSMFPHYFEKQKTDGVDYSIYVGGSLLEDGAFDPLYLRNLRLWQLMVACGIAVRADRLKPRLPVPLETTNLVLVQHAPLAIRFRFDEKRFDVDGAYNVRYEIIKKRIDKAVIRGTTERLTQPGRIAIVYSHAAEAAEYRQYVEYLQKLGYLTGDVEELELDELQGAQGMRALRVAVDLAHFPGEGAVAASAASGASLTGRAR